MPGPHLNIYEDILCRWNEILTGDPRIGGNDIQVIYSRVFPEDVDMNLMPYVTYFLEPNWFDDSVGTGSYSPQSRRITVKMGFLLAMMADEATKLDRALFKVGGDLLDIIREHMNFNGPKSIIVARNIVWDFDAIGVETGQQIGTQRISFSHDMFVNFG